MPYKDPDRQRRYRREWMRMNRAGERGTPSETQLPMPYRIETARDILDLLAEQIDAVRNASEASTLEKARAIGYLAGTALKAVELTEFGDRVAALEAALKGRTA